VRHLGPSPARMFRNHHNIPSAVRHLPELVILELVRWAECSRLNMFLFPAPGCFFFGCLLLSFSEYGNVASMVLYQYLYGCVMGEGLRRCARALNMNMAIAPTSVCVGLALVDIGPCAVRGQYGALLEYGRG